MIDCLHLELLHSATLCLTHTVPQGIELDFNNENAHRGEDDAGAGLAPPVSYGFSVTGAAPYRSTSAMLVSGPGTNRIWNRGIVFANDCVEQSTFQDLGNSQKSIDIRGNPKFGVYQSSAASQNYFAGKTGLGVEAAEATLHVGGEVRVERGTIVQISKVSPSAFHNVESIVWCFSKGTNTARCSAQRATM